MQIASRYLGISRPAKNGDVTYLPVSEIDKRECPVGGTQAMVANSPETTPLQGGPTTSVGGLRASCVEVPD